MTQEQGIDDPDAIQLMKTEASGPHIIELERGHLRVSADTGWDDKLIVSLSRTAPGMYMLLQVSASEARLLGQALIDCAGDE